MPVGNDHDDYISVVDLFETGGERRIAWRRIATIDRLPAEAENGLTCLRAKPCNTRLMS